MQNTDHDPQDPSVTDHDPQTQSITDHDPQTQSVTEPVSTTEHQWHPPQEIRNEIGNVVVYSEQQVRDRIAELGKEITAYYRSSPYDLVIVAMLKGSVFFLADLVRAIELPLTYDFTAIGVRDTKDRQGIVQITREFGINIHNKDVLILEEIIRTGLTTNVMMEYVEKQNPASIKICSMLFNPEQMLLPLPVEFYGFKIGYERLVGYGLDFREKGRTFTDIVLLNDDTVFPDKLFYNRLDHQRALAAQGFDPSADEALDPQADQPATD